MLAMLLSLSMLFQATASPAPAALPLTHQQVLEAHLAGVSNQGLLTMIAAAPSVAPASDMDMISLLQSGVPKEVVDAYRARLAATAPAAGPEDARLVDIVRLVRSGLSEELIGRQIRYSGQVYKLSVGDLIYLKNNQVPEAIISELIGTQNTAASAAAVAAAAKPAAFGPLLRMTGFLHKDAPGTLNLKEGRLEWLDGKKVERNFSLEVASIRTAWLECSPRPEGNFCFAVHLGLFNGDTYEFRDFSWESGSNSQILAFVDILKKSHPQIIFHEKVK